MNKIICISIPKDYDIEHKIKATTNPKEEFAYQATKRKPRQPFDRLILIHDGSEYHFAKAWWDDALGICYTDLIHKSDTQQKGFQGFRYKDRVETMHQLIYDIKQLP